MRMAYGVAMLVTALVVAGLPRVGQAQTGQDPPTQAQIQQMIDAKAYRPALQAIAQVLPAASAGRAPGYDKYTLLMMRGESLLQLKDGPTAIIAYEAAVPAADTREQNEAARAMALLVKRSPGLMYTPKAGGGKLDVTDAGQRKQAMAALLADELPGVSRRVNEALKAKSLPPILALGPTLRDMHALEALGTGGEKQTTELVLPLADRIQELIESELNRVDEQTKAIQRAASRAVDWGGGNFQMVNGGLNWVPAQGTSGLSGDNRQALRETIAYLGKIVDTCDDLTAVARSFDRDGKRWSDLGKRTKGMLDFATAVYDQSEDRGVERSPQRHRDAEGAQRQSQTGNGRGWMGQRNFSTGEWT